MICFPKLSINRTPINPTLLNSMEGSWALYFYVTTEQPPETTAEEFSIIIPNYEIFQISFPLFFFLRGVEGECEPAVKQMFLICC